MTLVEHAHRPELRIRHNFGHDHVANVDDRRLRSDEDRLCDPTDGAGFWIGSPVAVIGRKVCTQIQSPRYSIVIGRSHGSEVGAQPLVESEFHDCFPPGFQTRHLSHRPCQSPCRVDDSVGKTSKKKFCQLRHYRDLTRHRDRDGAGFYKHKQEVYALWITPDMVSASCQP